MFLLVELSGCIDASCCTQATEAIDKVQVDSMPPAFISTLRRAQKLDFGRLQPPPVKPGTSVARMFGLALRGIADRKNARSLHVPVLLWTILLPRRFESWCNRLVNVDENLEDAACIRNASGRCG